MYKQEMGNSRQCRKTTALLPLLTQNDGTQLKCSAPLIETRECMLKEINDILLNYDS